jgi:hypothetical protein
MRWFLVPLNFYTEDGGNIFLRNVGSHTDFTAVYPRRWERYVSNSAFSVTLRLLDHWDLTRRS